MRLNNRITHTALFAAFTALTLLFTAITSAASTITLGISFTPADVGSNCFDAASLNPIISFGSSAGAFSEIVNANAAGGVAPECALRDAFIEISLATRANSITFNYVALDDTQNISVRLEDGAVTVSNQAFDTSAAPGVFTYSGAFFNRVTIFVTSVTTVNPLRTTRLDEFRFTFPDDDPIANAIANQGFNPADDRIGAHAAATLNTYMIENGFAIYRTTPEGTTLALHVPQDQIDAAGIPQTAPVLILAGAGVEVYRLPDGLFQVMEAPTMEGKRDFLIFELDAEGNIVRWRRGTFNIYTQRSTIYAQSSSGWTGYPMEY